MPGSSYITNLDDAMKTFEERVARLFDAGKVTDTAYAAARECSAYAYTAAQAGQSYWDYAVTFAEYPLSSIATIFDSSDDARKETIIYWQYLNLHRNDFSTPSPNDEILIGNIIADVLTEIGFVTETEKEVSYPNQAADKVVDTAQKAGETLGKIGDKAGSALDSLATDQTPLYVTVAGLATAAVTYPLGLAIAAPATGAAIIASFVYGKYNAWQQAKK